MFKGIYNVYFAGVQYSVVKVIPNMSKNQAHQSYLILNYGGFCEFFSQNARNIYAESVPIRKFLAANVERIKSAFPCLLGLTILLLQTIFVSKKKQ